MTTGRVQQKERTHRALVASARALIAEGATPTVEDAAQRADVSRTTAYRYFPNQAALLAAAHPEIETASLLAGRARDVPGRVDEVVDAFTRLIADSEPQQRATLKLSLEVDPAARGSLLLRQGRAVAWLLEALEPAADALSPDDLRSLALAIRATTGIEALVWLTDVGGLDPQRARALMRWSARALTAAALAGDPPPRPRASRARGGAGRDAPGS